MWVGRCERNATSDSSKTQTKWALGKRNSPAWHGFFDRKILFTKIYVMKRISNVLSASSWGKKFMMLCTSVFISLLTFAQDKKIDVDINADKDSGGFFASPVVWVIGVAVFILLLVALMRNNSGRRTDV